MSQARGNAARAEILQHVRIRAIAREPSPTVREIAWAVRRSVSSTHRHVKLLVDSGLLTQTHGRARTIAPVMPTRQRR